MKISLAQCCVLEAASENHGVIDYYRAVKAGANGRTLAALVASGCLTKEDDRGTSLWRMTDEGHRVLFVAGSRVAR